MSCIARRAHPDRVSFRLVKEGKEGKYIWTEFKCPNVVSEGSLCTDCCKKLPKHKYQSNPKCDHGIIGGPYPTDSKLYGSPFYLKQLKEGFTILEADEKRAKEAIAKALSEMPRKKVTEVPTDAEVAVATATTTTIPTVVDTIKPKKPRVYKTKSVIPAVTVTTPVPQETVAAQMLESMAAPIMVSETVIVKVKKIRCQGKDYYLDSNSGKLYDVTKSGVGSYKGRYNSESEQLVDYPDSDVE
jgi:hypothetical protein